MPKKSVKNITFTISQDVGYVVQFSNIPCGMTVQHQNRLLECLMDWTDNPCPEEFEAMLSSESPPDDIPQGIWDSACLLIMDVEIVHRDYTVDEREDDE